MSERRSAAKDRATYLTYRVLGEAMQRIPEAAAAGAAAVVSEVLGRRRGDVKTMATRHVERLLAWDSPHAVPDPQLVERWTRRYFRSYGRYWMEGARIPAIPITTVDQRMQFERGYDHLRAGMAAGKGVVMALPHIGSWEWGGRWLAYDGMPMTAVAEVVEPAELFEYFIGQRKAMGLTMVPLGGESAKVVLSTLKAGGLIGLVCDRDLTDNGVPVEFFGEATTFPSGPATLALRTGAVLLPTVVYSGPGKGHTAVVDRPIDTSRTPGVNLRAEVARVTQELATRLEWFIRRAPEQWHVFQPVWESDRAALGQSR